MKSRSHIYRNFSLLVILCIIFALFPFKTYAATPEEYTGEFRKISTDGKLTVYSIAPKTAEEAQAILTSYVLKLVDTQKYDAYGCCEEKNFDPKKAIIDVYEIDGKYSETHNISITYIEPSKDIQTKVDTLLGSMKLFKTTDDITVSKAYSLDDLNLINFFAQNDKDKQHINYYSKALNFTKDVIKDIDGSNISFVFDVRAGEDSVTGLYDYGKGYATVYYNDMLTAFYNAGVTLNHVLYIPDSTEKTTSAYANAAKKRITDYLGYTDGIDVTYGGKLESLNHKENRYEENSSGQWVSVGEVDVSYNEHQLIDENTSDGNYYNITINGISYRFAVCAIPQNQLYTPNYLGKDVATDIIITSEESEIPLDTSLKVSKLENDISSKINTNNYIGYDIKLYSNFKEANISKLDNGMFTVKIPIPEALNGKEVTVYYLASTGELQEHKTVVNNGAAIFETNHFSTYILAEKAENGSTDENGNEGKANEAVEENDNAKAGEDGIISPETADYNNIAFLLLSFLISGGIIIGLIYKK